MVKSQAMNPLYDILQITLLILCILFGTMEILSTFRAIVKLNVIKHVTQSIITLTILLPPSTVSHSSPPPTCLLLVVGDQMSSLLPQATWKRYLFLILQKFYTPCFPHTDHIGGERGLRRLA